MATVNKIDSNVTAVRYSEEVSKGVLPGSPVWNVLEANPSPAFNTELTLLARNPINDSRQRKKGVITDLEATVSMNIDLTQTNLQDIMQGYFFADTRKKGVEIVTAVDLDVTNPDEYEVASTTGFQVNNLIQGVNFTNTANNAVNLVTAVVVDTSVEVADGLLTVEASPPADANIRVVGFQGSVGDFTIDVSGALPKLVSVVADFTTMGLIVGEWIFIGGDSTTDVFFNAVNNGFKRIRSISATELEFDKSVSTMVTDDGTVDGAGGAGNLIKLYFGDVLKNESGTDIIGRSYNVELLLGAPDDAAPTQIQSQYAIGSVPNELAFNIDQAGKITCDLSFVAIDSEQRTGITGVKSGTRPALVDADAFNTSSDFSRIKLSKVSSTDEAITPLVGFVTDLTLTINNNLTVNKAVGVLGGFDVTAGMFTVNADTTAYFSDIAAVQAVRNNDDITLDFAVVKNNAGTVVDVPLVALGGGSVAVEQDEAIKLPLSMDAASAAKVDANLDHTLLMGFFHVLPDAADV